MDFAVALGEPAEKLGLVAATGAAVAALLLPDARRRAAALAAAVVIAAVVLVGHIWNTDQFRSISGNPSRFALLVVLGLTAVVALGALFERRPALFPLAAVATLPFRVPIDAGGSTVNLLVPLYVVIAGAVAAYCWRAATSEQSPAASERPGLLEMALAVFLGLYALQSLYSRDLANALEQTVFFYVPFAVLFVLLRQVRWTRSQLLGCIGVLVALGLVFSVIGFWEYDHRELLWNPKVINANQAESYFRVNSVFWDPNVYGRFLALVMVVLAGIMLWSGRLRVALAMAAALAVLWGGLVLTFSQSSIASLLAGLATLAALRWDVRRTVAASVVGIVAAAVLVLSFQSALHLHLDSSSGLNTATSGRSNLIQGGVELFADRPLWGQGSGAFARAYRLERKGNQQNATSASHTMPITVAAEQGLIGLAAYLALLAAAFVTLLGFRRPAEAPDPAPGALDGGLSAADLGAYPVARAALAAAFVTLVAHTMMYAAFLEDPFTWVILAVGASIASYVRVPASRRASAPSAAAARATA
jgi:O-antigen ligase